MATATNTQDVQNFIVFGTLNTFKYKNHRGETSMRKVIPHCLRYGNTPLHQEDQWLLEAFDCVKGEFRTFALKDIDPR